MSEYDGKTGVKNLRVRGMEAVRFCATLKAVGINIFRATAVMRAKISPDSIRKRASRCVFRICFYVTRTIVRAFCVHRLRYFPNLRFQPVFRVDLPADFLRVHQIKFTQKVHNFLRS